MKITVLMPVYNGEKYLAQAIDSMLAQTFHEFEFLIINDGSTDKSEEIILSYKDLRIRYIKNEQNLKLIATLNKGIDLAKGKYIVRMDADDISLPERLEKQFSFMEKNLQVAICGSWFQSFGINNSMVKYVGAHEEIMFRMLYQCHLCHPSLIWRRSAITSFEHMFDPLFAHAEDYDFFVRVGQRFGLANLQEVLVKYRTHADSVSVVHKQVQEHNSNIIRRREFEELGYKIKEAELRDYIRLNYQDYESVELEPEKVMAMLEGIYKANEATGYFSNAFLHKMLAGMWYHYCYKMAWKSQYLKSAILSSPVGLGATMKWSIKRILNK
jgi:glycosyltransferase involved in cell wall biosynthesis